MFKNMFTVNFKSLKSNYYRILKMKRKTIKKLIHE